MAHKRHKRSYFCPWGTTSTVEWLLPKWIVSYRQPWSKRIPCRRKKNKFYRYESSSKIFMKRNNMKSDDHRLLMFMLKS